MHLRIFPHLTVYIITATCTLGILQPCTTGDHSYRSEVEVECHLGWRSTFNNNKNVPELMVILPQPHNIVSL